MEQAYSYYFVALVSIACFMVFAWADNAIGATLAGLIAISFYFLGLGFTVLSEIKPRRSYAQGARS